MDSILIDASCILAVILNEPMHETVVSVVGTKQLVAPTCLSFEIGNAISKLIKRDLISVFEGVAIFHEFMKIPIKLVEPDIPNSIILAGETKSYAYDAFYITIAQHLAIPLYTLDDKMKETAKLRGIPCL